MPTAKACFKRLKLRWGPEWSWGLEVINILGLLRLSHRSECDHSGRVGGVRRAANWVRPPTKAGNGKKEMVAESTFRVETLNWREEARF